MIDRKNQSHLTERNFPLVEQARMIGCVMGALCLLSLQLQRALWHSRDNVHIHSIDLAVSVCCQLWHGWIETLDAKPDQEACYFQSKGATPRVTFIQQSDFGS